MKIKKKKSVSILKVVVVPLVLVLALGAGCYWAWLTTHPANDNKPTSTDKSNVSDQAADKSTNQQTDSESNNQSDSSTTEPEKEIINDQPTTGQDLSVWVTSQQIVGGTLQIRVQIDQNISSGTCTLTIGNYSTSVPVAFEPQSASCQGFDVPTSAYSDKNFVIKVESGDKTGSTSGAIQ
jgi:cytoskeletal protein RodZ